MKLLERSHYTRKLGLWITVCLIIVSVSRVPVHADTSSVHIENKRLETVIRNALQKPTGLLTAEDMASLTSIQTNMSRITSLKGLEHAHNLKELYIVNSEVSDLGPIAKLNKLQSITLIDNNISDIRPLQQLKSVTYLDLNRNIITDLSPLESLTALQNLDVSTNLISDIQPLAKLVHLERLNISDNYIESLKPLQAMTALYRLDAMGNLVRDLSPLGALTKLDALNVSSNKIHDLDPIQPLNLNSLEIANTNVTDLSAIENMNTLHYIYASHSLSLDQKSRDFLALFEAVEGNGVYHYNTFAPPKIFINGEVQKFAIRPELMNGRMMTPLRSLLEWTGADWAWDGKTRQVTLKYNNAEIMLTIDSNVIIENGKSRTIDAKPFIRDGYTMVPIRFVTEAFGFHLEYDDKLKWVSLNSRTIS